MTHKDVSDILVKQFQVRYVNDFQANKETRRVLRREDRVDTSFSSACSQSEFSALGKCISVGIDENKK